MGKDYDLSIFCYFVRLEVDLKWVVLLEKMVEEVLEDVEDSMRNYCNFSVYHGVSFVSEDCKDTSTSTSLSHRSGKVIGVSLARIIATISLNSGLSPLRIITMRSISEN